MASRPVRELAFRLLGVVTLSVGVTAGTVSTANEGAAPAAPRRVSSLPIVAEHRYRMAAKIRPFLFWIGREDVGAAHVVWRRSPDGAVGFELLIGSDPIRAPRRINRWGYIAEEVRRSEARLVGVMKESNEQSLDEAKSRLASQGQEGRYVFKAIRGEASAGEARSRVTTIRLTRDLTFRDVQTLLELVERDSAGGTERHVQLANGTRPGFLVALAELIHRDVAAQTEPSAGHSPAATRSLPYVYNGTLGDLTLRESERRREVRVGTHRHYDVIRARFEARNRATGEATEFELLYGASGSFAGIPAHAVYRPRWWLQLELFLDQADES